MSCLPIGKEFLLYLAKKFNEMGTFFPSYMPIGKRFYRPVYSYFHVKITFQKRKSVSKLLYLRNVSIFFCYQSDIFLCVFLFVQFVNYKDVASCIMPFF